MDRQWLCALLAVAGVAPVAALAQSVTLTEDSGRPLVVGGDATLGSQLQPTTATPQAVVAEFQRLCLPDPATAATRATGSVLTPDRGDAIFPAEGKQGEARVPQWRGPSALMSVWTGEDANLRKRPIAIPSRASTTTGPYGPFRADGAQCNLVVMLPGFASATELSGALTAAFGAPGKLVAKKTFADGFWRADNGGLPVRINFTAPTTRSGPQPVHLSAQVLTKGTRR